MDSLTLNIQQTECLAEMLRTQDLTHESYGGRLHFVDSVFSLTLKSLQHLIGNVSSTLENCTEAK